MLTSQMSRPARNVENDRPAVLATCRAMQRLHAIDVTYRPVDRNGLVSPAELAAAITPHTALVSITMANNETGTTQRIGELARVAPPRTVLAVPRDHALVSLARERLAWTVLISTHVPLRG